MRWSHNRCFEPTLKYARQLVTWFILVVIFPAICCERGHKKTQEHKHQSLSIVDSMIQSTCVCLCIPMFTCDIWLNLSKPLVHPTVTPLASLSKRPISPRALGKNSWLIQNWATATRYISGYTRNHLTWAGHVQRQGQCWNRQRVRKGKDWRRCSNACVGTWKDKKNARKKEHTPPFGLWSPIEFTHRDDEKLLFLSYIHDMYIYIYILYNIF